MAVREDSKLGIVGTEGNGEMLPPGLKFRANSFLEGSWVDKRCWPPSWSQPGTFQGQSHFRLASSKASPKGHLNS